MAELWKLLESQTADALLPLQQLLGGGPSGAVYLSEYEGRKAAVKLVRRDSWTAEKQLFHWQRAAKLAHPHLIRILRTGECQLGGAEFLYIAMEYAEENLAQVLAERPLTSMEAREMLGPAIDALGYLHAHGFVHGRLKLSNIMAAGDQLKISSDGLRRTGDGASPADDVWALAATMVEALTQRAPAASGTGDPVLPAALENPFLDIALHCLRRDPRQRWTLFDISTRLGQPAPRSVSPKRRYLVPAAVLAAAVLAAVAGRELLTPRPEPARADAVQPVAQPVIQPAIPAEAPKAPPEAPPARFVQPDPPKPVQPSKPEPLPPTQPANPQDVIEQIVPEIPAKVRDGIRGRVRVVVKVRTNPDGSVTEAAVQSSSSRFFSGITQHAAERWKFQPAGEPRDWILRFDYMKTGTNVFPERVTLSAP
jgi:eukaryotic-like serine/threonine-protein kinase